MVVRTIKRLVSGLYNIHLEIAGDHCNLIGSQQCYLFTNCTIFCSSLPPANEKIILKQNEQSNLKACLKQEIMNLLLKITNQIAGK